MIDRTTDDAALDAWEGEGGSRRADAQRIFRDGSRYQSREVERVLGSLTIPSAGGDRACQLVHSEPPADDDSIIRATD